MGKIDVMNMWPGRCRRPCRTIWYWPRAGHLLTEDLEKEPKCPVCGKELARTQGTSNDAERATTRVAVGLE